MRYKVLRHKEIQNIYGEVIPSDDPPSLAQSPYPSLMDSDMTLERIRDFWVSRNGKSIINSLTEYELVTADVLIIEK